MFFVAASRLDVHIERGMCSIRLLAGCGALGAVMISNLALAQIPPAPPVVVDQSTDFVTGLIASGTNSSYGAVYVHRNANLMVSGGPIDISGIGQSVMGLRVDERGTACFKGILGETASISGGQGAYIGQYANVTLKNVDVVGYTNSAIFGGIGSKINLVGGSLATQDNSIALDVGADSTINISAGTRILAPQSGGIRTFGNLTADGFAIRTGFSDWNATAPTAVAVAGDGVNVQSNARVNLSNGTIETHGYGIYAATGGQLPASANYNVRATNVDIVTYGQSATGIEAASSRILFEGGSITTNGYGAHGIGSSNGGSPAWAGSDVTINGTAITTKGDSAYGLVVNRGAIINMNDAEVVTFGAGAHAVLSSGTGTLNIARSSITTSGEAAAVVVADSGGSMTVSGSELHAHGGGSPAVWLNGAAGTTNLITLSDTAIYSDQDAAFVVASGNQNTVNLTRVNAVSGAGLLFNAYATDNGAVGTVVFSADASTLDGDVQALSGDSSLNVKNGSSWSGAARHATGASVNLTLQGASTWTVTGPSTLTNLTLDSSTLRYGTATAVNVDNPVDLAAGGGTIDTNGFNSVFGSAMAGTGALIKMGAGTLALSGGNRYTGGTAILGGTLQLGDGGTTGSIIGNVINNSVLAFNRRDDVAFAEEISGSGAVNQLGSGKTILTGTNRYTGGTAVQAGVLQAGSAGAFVNNTAYIVNGGTLDLNSINLTMSSLSGAGGAVAFGNANLTVDQSVTTTYAGAMGGGGNLNKTGAGTLTLSGDSSGFTGLSTVTAGALAVNGTLGGTLDVYAGGRLYGAGVVGNTTVAGTLAPGNPIGRLTVNGDLTMLAGSVYEVNLSPTQSDRIDVAGAANLGSGTVSTIKEGSVYLPGSQWTILNAAGGVNGAFAALVEDLPYVDLKLGYDTNNVYLNIVRNDTAFCLSGFSRNQCSSANGVESLGRGNGLYDIAASQASAEAAARAFDQLSGEIHASVKTALIEDSRFVRDAATARIRSAFGSVGASSTPVLAYGAGGPQAAAADTEQLAVWGNGFGSWGHVKGDGNASRLNHDTGGFLVGADAALSGNARLGVMAGYSHNRFDVNARGSSGASDNYHLGAYSGGQWGSLGLRGGLAYTWHKVDTSRSVQFPGFMDSLKADYNAGLFQAFGEVGYRMGTAHAAFEPFANLAHVSLHTDGHKEHGGLAALMASGQNTNVTFTTLGLRGSTELMLGGISTTARGSLGWQHVLGDTAPATRHAFSGGSLFAVAGVPIAKDSAIADVGLDFNISRLSALSLSYTGQLSSGASQHGFNARFSTRF